MPTQPDAPQPLPRDRTQRRAAAPVAADAHVMSLDAENAALASHAHVVSLDFGLNFDDDDFANFMETLPNFSQDAADDFNASPAEAFGDVDSAAYDELLDASARLHKVIVKLHASEEFRRKLVKGCEETSVEYSLPPLPNATRWSGILKVRLRLSPP